MSTVPSPRRSFGSSAVRLGNLVLARAEAALAPLELTPFAYETMSYIAAGDGPSQQELSRQLKIYAQKMVGVIDALEARGLVERKVSLTDRRRHSLQLTASGQALLERAAAVATALEAELFGSVPAEDRARFATLVERLEAAAPEPAPKNSGDVCV